ncbi:hypothetical protein A9179_01555 [Pseudomonas alcaligenes]|uniref:Lipoprotein n=1 Tax=Aquipseudomonas alcaligenes TaxID=43263 RepID=A0ABR7RUT6_AQUAC|nr:hypothetical protein [Pseudomonas alcaligenes]MBC9248951.1 hypothetical protein [Pseudomonas alcaligenes]
MSLRLPGALCALLLLAGCAQQPPTVAPTAPQPAPPSDPLRCVTRAECTTKVSRTLLFVFDYAAAGGALVERDGRLLFTPDTVTSGDWPALQIRLAAAADSHFEFSSACRAQGCRYQDEQLRRVYRSYLAGAPCSLLLDSAIRGCRE